MNPSRDDMTTAEMEAARERATVPSEARRMRQARVAESFVRDEIDAAMLEAWEASKPEEEIMTEAIAEAPVTTGTGLIHKAIAAIMGDLAPIAKDRRNTQQGFSYRGIDDLYNALHPILSKRGVYCVPDVLSRDVQERATQRGGTLFYTRIDVRFTLVCAEDGSSISGKVVGEAMDSGDKSANKAMSAAMKYFYFMIFCIPTEGDNDADATTPPQVAPADPKREALKEEIGAAFDKSCKQPAPSAPPAEEPKPAQHITELLSICEKFGLKDVQKEAWCKYFKVVRIEDLAPDHVKAIVAKINKMFATQN